MQPARDGQTNAAGLEHDTLEAADGARMECRGSPDRTSHRREDAAAAATAHVFASTVTAHKACPPTVPFLTPTPALPGTPHLSLVAGSPPTPGACAAAGSSVCNVLSCMSVCKLLLSLQDPAHVPPDLPAPGRVQSLSPGMEPEQCPTPAGKKCPCVTLGICEYVSCKGTCRWD